MQIGREPLFWEMFFVVGEFYAETGTAHFHFLPAGIWWCLRMFSFRRGVSKANKTHSGVSQRVCAPAAT
jgi:hypothetical protein